MTIDEAIRILRQHNQTGVSVMRITKGRATEMELLAQVLNRCEQNEVELKEAKRLLKMAVEQMAEVGDVCDCIHSQNCPLDECGKFTFYDEIMKFINN